MTGYQADLGDKYWGSLYDESRRNKTLVAPEPQSDQRDPEARRLERLRDPREGPRIRLSINGRQTVDYTEPDPTIPREGLIGLQVHGGGKAEAWA